MYATATGGKVRIEFTLQNGRALFPLRTVVVRLYTHVVFAIVRGG